MKQFEYKTVVVINENVSDVCNREAENNWRPVMNWYRDINSGSGREYRLLLERPISNTPVPTKRFKDIE